MSSTSQALPNTQPTTFRVEMALAPRPWEIWALITSAAVILITYLVGAYWFVRVVTPTLLTIIMGAANYQLARSSAAAIWTPLFAVRLAVMIFFGVGELLQLMNAAALDEMNTLYLISEGSAAKVNLIWLFSTAILLTACRSVSSVRPAAHALTSPLLPKFSPLSVGILFSTVSFAYAFFILIPQNLGLLTTVIPASLTMPLEASGSVGIFLIALWALERRGGSHIAYLLPLSLWVAIGLICFNKSMVIVPLLFVCLAVLFHAVTLPRIAVVIATLLLAFAILQPMVAHARGTHAYLYGDYTGGSVGERLGYSIEWVRGSRLPDAESGQVFTRLAYLGPASFVVQQYDVGLSSDTIEDLPTALIPRIFWPDKPEVTAGGAHLNELIFGHTGSRLAPTVFADIYWNFGWVGIGLVLPFLGALLWVGTRIAHRILLRRDWLMMPFVLLCYQIGLGVDGFFVSGVALPLVAAVIAYAILVMLKRVISPPAEYLYSPAR